MALPEVLAGRLLTLEREYAECEAMLGDPEIVGDQSRYIEMSRRYSELRPIAECSTRLRELKADLAAARELLELAEGADREQIRDEMAEIESDAAELEDTLKLLLVPSDPFDQRDVIV